MSDPRDELISEKRVMMGLLEVLTLYGYTWWRVGQADARRTIDPGISDIVALSPNRGVLFVEAKTPRGRQSRAQKAFEKACGAAGVPYVCGGVDELLLYLRAGVRTA